MPLLFVGKELGEKSNFELIKRNNFPIVFKHKNEFEKFLFNLILTNFPKCFLENFKLYKKKVNQLPLSKKPKAIFALFETL